MDPEKFLGKFYQKHNIEGPESPGIESSTNDESDDNLLSNENSPISETRSRGSTINSEIENDQVEELPFDQDEKLVYSDENLNVKCQRLKFKRLKNFCLTGKQI